MAWSRFWFAIFGVTILFRSARGSISSWKMTPKQYHIQTDEGDGRFFKFQTFNGQFRKERRLNDGTVIGSYGWVDPTGFLRMTDFIANERGYRVVKEVTKFVGMNSIMDNALIIKYPSKRYATKVAIPSNTFITSTK